MAVFAGVSVRFRPARKDTYEDRRSPKYAQRLSPPLTRSPPTGPDQDATGRFLPVHGAAVMTALRGSRGSMIGQATMSLSPGTRLGHYDVTALLGEGGMGQPGNGCLSRGTPR